MNGVFVLRCWHFVYSPGPSCVSWWNPLLIWPRVAAEHLSRDPEISANGPGQNLQKQRGSDASGSFIKHALEYHQVYKEKLYIQHQSLLINLPSVNPPQAASFLTVHVLQELWEIEELWDELFDVSRTLHACLPGCCYRVELSVSAVKPVQRHTPACHHGALGRPTGSCLAQCSHLPLCSWICRVVNGSIRIM